MSYAAGAALQAAVYQRLMADAALAALIGPAVFDAVPQGPVPGTYVTFGPEEAREAGDLSGGGAEHRFVVSVVTDAPGFRGAKAVAGAVSDALAGAELVLARGRLVGLWFDRARARREERAGLRRIDLTFRARVEV